VATRALAVEPRGPTITTTVVMATLAPNTKEEELIVTRTMVTIEVDSRIMVRGLTKEGPIISRESSTLTR
jgi:hypothetical protein